MLRIGDDVEPSDKLKIFGFGDEKIPWLWKNWRSKIETISETSYIEMPAPEIRLALKWTIRDQFLARTVIPCCARHKCLKLQITSIICVELFANSCIVDYDMCMWSHKILDAFLDRICSYPFVLKTERFWYFSWNAHERFDFHSVAKCIHNHRTSTKILIYLNENLTSICPRAALMPWHRSSLLCQHSEKGSIKN